jgi:citrate lyase subunit beta/citryl-CoA lyase
MLFVPGDSERKFAKGSGAGADALILDLEDAVAPSMKDSARALVSALLDDKAERSWRFFVRVNPFDTGMTFDDMAAVVKPGLDGLLIPKANSAQDVARVAAELDR